MLPPFFAGAYFAYVVVDRVRSAILKKHGYTIQIMTCILSAACG